MKKGQIYDGIVERIDFPNKGIVNVSGEEGIVIVKNVIPGQKIRFSVNKVRKGRAEGRLLELLEKSPVEIVSECPHFTMCGGCVYQSLPYEKQLEIKQSQVKNLLDNVCPSFEFEGIKGSPNQYEYRNKMEFSFGDEVKDGPLSLGMHKRGSFYDIVTVNECKIVDCDFRLILESVLNYFAKKGSAFYHKMSHDGFLRHLLVRKGVKSGEILIDLVTSSQEKLDENEFVSMLLSLDYSGKLVGILHTINDSLADVVQSDETHLLYGQDYFYEELLGLKFKISPFSFFQTNSLGAEILYETVRSYIGDLTPSGCKPDKVIYDLYSGTGTIAQMLSKVAKKVIGVEIVEEAVEAARENAQLNGLHNCEFLTGDVLKMLDEIDERPDLIVLDPPREGIHPKALSKIIDYGVDRMIYISCKPTSLARDLVILQERGYTVEKVCCVDMFPGTVHVESIVELVRK